MGAWNAMPIKHPLWFVHGLPGNRNVIRQEPNGEVGISSIARWFNLPKSPKDTDRKGWDGELLTLDFGFPAESKRAGRELLDGYLPQLRTWWVDGPIYYEQTTLLDKLGTRLGQDPHGRSDRAVDARAGVEHVGDGQGHGPPAARVRGRGGETLVIEGDRVLARRPDGARLRCLFRRAAAVRSPRPAMRSPGRWNWRLASRTCYGRRSPRSR